MARPQKRGLDYFPFDVDFWEDVKVRKVSARYASKGIAILMRLYTEIYREGYYLDVKDEDTLLLISELCPRDVCVEDLEEILGYMLKIGIFDENLYYSDKILTSVAIQERYSEAKKVAKHIVCMDKHVLIEIKESNRKDNDTEGEFLRKKPQKMEGKKVVSSEETPEKSEILKTKGKQNKEKEKKEKKENEKKDNNLNSEEEEFMDFGELKTQTTEVDMETAQEILKSLDTKTRERAQQLLGSNDIRLAVLKECPEVSRKQTFLLIERLDELKITDVNHVSWFCKKSRWGKEGTPIWTHLYAIRTKKINNPLNYLFKCMSNESKPGTRTEEETESNR